ncbi:MAG: hypothetical protein GY870_11815 [archaeon]|nr:hypothetical protein [archaeon]
MAEVLLGKTDAVTAYFTEAAEAKGDMELMLIFVQILEKALIDLEILKEGELEPLLETKTMKNLFKIYKAEAEGLEPEHVPMFLKVLATFVNLNPEAQEEIEDTNYVIKMSVDNIADYNIKIADGVMTYSKESLGEPSMTFKMDVNTVGELISDGDAVSAFMAGKITVDGELNKAMEFQTLMEMLMNYIDID